MRPPLLQQLKQATLGQHEQLEQHLQLLRPTMSLPEYRALLESLYGFYAPWEQCAAPFLHRVLPGFFEKRCKTPFLEKDLRVLRSNLAAIPQCPSLPDTTSLLTLLGSLYVLEGATLGGQILTKHFVRQFHLSCEEGCSFFSSYGLAVGQRWRVFCDLLISYSSPDHNAVIVQSAVDTFRYLGQWLRAGDQFPVPQQELIRPTAPLCRRQAQSEG